MHEELREELQADTVEIVGVNEIGYDNYEYVTTVSSTLPWVQDVEEVNAWDLWEITYRDVVILDRENIYLSTYNLTDNPMWTTTLGGAPIPNESYETLKNIFRHVALYNELPPEPEPEDAGILEDTDGGEGADSGAFYWPPADNEDPEDDFDDAGATEVIPTDSGTSLWVDAGDETDVFVGDAGSTLFEDTSDSGDDDFWEDSSDAGEWANPLLADAGHLIQAMDSGADELLMDSGTTSSQVMDAGSSLDLLDGAVAQATDGGSTTTTYPMSDFYLPDGNPYSPTQGDYFSPRDNIGKVSAYYFGSGG